MPLFLLHHNHVTTESRWHTAQHQQKEQQDNTKQRMQNRAGVEMVLHILM
jgi:hypothetical protein